MKIKRIQICDDYHILFDETFGKKTLIWSSNNSNGKTTLIRFILYSMGFDVPSTKKINFAKYNTIIELSEPNVKITRKRELLKVIYEDREKSFNLSSESINAIGSIFGLNNVKIIKNILGAFYIDQDKGWTLLNRGKVTSSIIKFDIDDFIIGVSDYDTIEYDTSIENMKNEIKRYEAILNIVKLSEEHQEGYKRDNNIINLKCKKANIEFFMKEINDQIEELETLLANNMNLINIVESYRLCVKIPNKKETIPVNRSTIKDFDLNTSILSSQIKELNIKKTQLKEKLVKVNNELSQYNGMFNIKSLSSEIVEQVKNISISQTQLSDLIEEMKKEKKKLEKDKGKIILKQNEIVEFLKNNIREYASTLNVFQGYIDKETDYLRTKNLKEYSGSLYHKVTLCYRLAYYSCIRYFLNLNLPFIVDSPGSTEITKEGLYEIISLIKKVIGDEQIILSSIYDEELNFEQDKQITLKMGIFGNNQ